jgi:hypothetical protein
MKSLKDYLTESKKTYQFKVKVAGDLPENFEKDLKGALEKYKVLGVKKSTTPVQKVPLDFPEKENMEVHIFEVDLEYAVTDQILQGYLLEKTSVASSCMKVRNSNDPLEDYTADKDQAYIVKMTAPLENLHPEIQKVVGEEGKLNFLASIAKERTEPTVYTGINDEILAKTAPKESVKDYLIKDEKANSVLANKKMPEPKGAKK